MNDYYLYLEHSYQHDQEISQMLIKKQHFNFSLPLFHPHYIKLYIFYIFHLKILFYFILYIVICLSP